MKKHTTRPEFPLEPTPYFPPDLENYAPWVAKHGLKYPYGKCQCGCGQKVNIAPVTNARRGWIKNEPRRFLFDHHFKPAEHRFWNCVNRSDSDQCWEWQGTKRNSYGTLWVNGRPIGAHRYSYELHYGPIPEGMYVCHNCPDGDNKACVNPNHLFLGTQADNVRDYIDKGRANPPVGSASHFARLTEQDVQEIRKRHRQGTRYFILAKEFGVTHTTISNIVKRKTWKHLP